MIRSWRFQSTLSRGERRGDAVYANKKRIDHWLKTLSLAGAPNGSLVVDSFNLSRIIPDETDLGKLFQSTLSRGERPMSFSFITLLEIFQSTLSRGERPMSFSFITLLEIFQSTLSRGERQRPASNVVLTVCISIHALTRRAALQATAILRRLANFNPRSHEESGLATLLAPLLFRYFNPRSHEESGLLWKNWKEFNGEFQSTLSRGERPLRSAFALQRFYISIHALTRRAAEPIQTFRYKDTISIHALTRRAALQAASVL